ncbi:MAG: hypothetical protein M3071_08970 [Actinomycetota bacterium]|nr:hypothetical protein [Actinomycetota bacterium]
MALVLEDMHWADRSTRTFAQFLARSPREERVMLLLTYRTDELHGRHPLRPLLAELDPDRDPRQYSGLLTRISCLRGRFRDAVKDGEEALAATVAPTTRTPRRRSSTRSAWRGSPSARSRPACRASGGRWRSRASSTIWTRSPTATATSRTC